MTTQDRHRTEKRLNKTAIGCKSATQKSRDAKCSSCVAVSDDKGELVTNDILRNRFTGGVTLSYLRSKSVFVDLRLNYEKYFYPDDAQVASGAGDKAVVAIVLRF